MKMLYFRGFNKITFKNTSGEEIECDCNRLTPIERLFISAFLTKFSTGSKKKLEEILFATKLKDKLFTPFNFKQYASLINDVVDNKYIGLVHWIEDTFSVDSSKTGASKFSVYAEPIDADLIYATRNGKGGYSLSPIAFKAFVLASAKSGYKKNKVATRIPIINWLNGNCKSVEELSEKEISAYLRNKSQTKIAIKKWLDIVGIDYEFEGDWLHVKGMTNKDEKEFIDKVNSICKEKKEELLEKALKDSLSKEELNSAIDEEAASTVEPKHDDGDDFSLYTNEDWTEYYFTQKEKHHDCWHKVIQYINDNGCDINDEVRKIAKKLGVKIEVVNDCIKKNWVSDKNGGIKMKDAISAEIKKLKNRIITLQKDESWQGRHYPTIGNILIGYAYEFHREVMEA